MVVLYGVLLKRREACTGECIQSWWGPRTLGVRAVLETTPGNGVAKQQHGALQRAS